ncbi:MAG: threonine/serine exporter family protein [Desulfobacterales bacterium]|jgi:uncharacterized membrane protein YjjB (DUF3815 family)|nr:threonine/serine exporter family protein [Desulfobacterales bacterium]
MDLLAILMNSLWAGLFAGGLGILLTAPPRYIVPAFLSGFAGRFVRDAFMSWGMNQNWSTAVAAAVVVWVAVILIRGHEVSPVVMISGVLPLGAAVAMFNGIVELMRVSSIQGEALSGASVALIANMGKVFTTSLAIALGLGAGVAITRLFRREGE